MPKSPEEMAAAMVSHRVRLERAADVDKDVKAWLQKAWSEA